MTGLSGEQKAIVDAPSEPLSVIACPGSGKTFTAVHRLLAISEKISASRSRVALLSFSNVAITTFARSYATLVDANYTASDRGRVDIDTFDGFITTHILKPHAYRVMGANRAAYLVTGDEPFLKGFSIKSKPFPKEIVGLKVRFHNGNFIFYFEFHSKIDQISQPVALTVVKNLGRTGAYTHDLGRYWAYQCLSKEPKLLKVLAQRYSHILIDEAQDVGSTHQAILELLINSGVQVSLIGDPDQGIYEYAGADGAFLRNYGARPGILSYSLTRNYRSIKSITNISNAIARRTDEAHREDIGGCLGAYIVPYAKSEEGTLAVKFEQTLSSLGFEASRCAVLCRGTAMVESLAGIGAPIGFGVVKHLAAATICRDERKDYLRAFQLVTIAVAGLLSNPPHGFISQMRDAVRYPEMISIRRAIWSFTRSPDKGLPSASLQADSEWHQQLLERMQTLLLVIEKVLGLTPCERINSKLTRRDLPSRPVNSAVQSSVSGRMLRIATVHQAKGESLDAVLFIVTKEQLEAFLEGTLTELGRIGYVAITRTKNLFWLGVPEAHFSRFKHRLTEKGFLELPSS
jgi:superfamily I DNA/RNA helicase